MSEINVGDKAWWLRYGNSLVSGKCQGVKKKPFGGEKLYLLEHSEGWDVLEGSKLIFSNIHEAKLHLAQAKQQEAARALTEAANLFKEAGLETAKEVLPISAD